MIINRDFRDLQALLVDFASTRHPDNRQEKIDQAARILQSVHTLSPAEAHAKLLAAADLCSAHAFLRVNIIALAEMLTPPRSPQVPAADKKLRAKPRPITNMGAGLRTDTPAGPSPYWWNRD